MLICTRIERLRSIDEEKVSILLYPFGEMQHFLCRGYPPRRKSACSPPKADPTA